MSPVSVVIVSHESGDVLARCLQALPAAAPRRGVETWVVDNASTDDSVAIAGRYLPGAQVLPLDSNRGFSAGVNVGLQRATGTAVAVLNPDAVPHSGSLDVLADLVEQSPRAGLIAPLVLQKNGRPEASVGWFPSAARERNHA